MPLRTSLFLLTNLAVVATIAVLLGLATAIGLLPPDLPFTPLLIGSFFWGAVGSWISLQMSRESAINGMGVQLVDQNSGPEARWLVQTVAGLAEKAGLPMPDVGIYAAPELEAVLGHELSHVGNGDMVTMSLLQGVVNAFVLFFVRLLWMAMPRSTDEQGRVRAPSLVLVQPLEVLLGLGGSLITAWFSRHREYRADAGAASLVGPDAMVGALERLGGAMQLSDRRDGPAFDNLKISAPPQLLGLLASHPPLEDRIRALREAKLKELQTVSP
jgi:heat shock protein HtpX